MANQTQIPSARVPITEGENNLTSREWFRYFNNINTIVGGGAGLIPASSGGTGVSTIPANGQLLIGNGTGYTLNTLSAGTNIAVANGAGSISVSFSGILAPSQGGTGTSTIPPLGSVLIGNGTNYTVGTVTAGPGINVNSSGTAITVSLAGGVAPPVQDGQDADGTDFFSFIPTQPAGSTTQIQYNNGGAFGASANFTYTSGTNTLTTGNITGSATSMIIQPRAITSGSGGSLELNTRGGASTNSNGGDLYFNLGAGGGTGSGGNFSLTTGNLGADSGAVFIINGATPGVGGAVVVGSGYAGTGAGGDYQFYLGGGALDDGNMYFQDPTGSNFIWCKTDGSGGAQQIGFFNATPVTQPTSVPVTAAGIHAALVSLGLIT